MDNIFKIILLASIVSGATGVVKGIKLFLGQCIPKKYTKFKESYTKFSIAIPVAIIFSMWGVMTSEIRLFGAFIEFLNSTGLEVSLDPTNANFVFWDLFVTGLLASKGSNFVADIADRFFKGRKALMELDKQNINFKPNVTKTDSSDTVRDDTPYNQQENKTK